MGRPPLQPYQATISKANSALTELERVENKLDRDERKLVALVAHYYSQERALASARSRLVAAQHRYRFMSAMQTAARPRFSAVPTGNSFAPA